MLPLRSRMAPDRARPGGRGARVGLVQPVLDHEGPAGHPTADQPVMPDVVKIAAQVDVYGACLVLNDCLGHPAGPGFSDTIRTQNEGLSARRVISDQVFDFYTLFGWCTRTRTLDPLIKSELPLISLALASV
jgi:hypothetical protein